MDCEKYFANLKALETEGWLKVAKPAKEQGAGRTADGNGAQDDAQQDGENQNETKEGEVEEEELGKDLLEIVGKLKKGSELKVSDFAIKLGETAPPKRYSSGSMILAMENAGQLIEDEELRAQIKGSGIGTSATRAEILNKLIRIEYIAINKKTQILTPTLRGEVIYEVVNASIRGLLNPELTASWEKGLTGVADGRITENEYLVKLEQYIRKMTDGVKGLNNSSALEHNFRYAQTFYGKSKK
jgi:DNA topoisomerase-3